MKDLLEFILTGITEKGNFTIKQTKEDGKINFLVTSTPESVGLIIGKGGRTIKAIQNILRVRARIEKVSVFVEVRAND